MAIAKICKAAATTVGSLILGAMVFAYLVSAPQIEALVLTSLLPSCPSDWIGSCDAEVFKKVWMKVDSNDGKITMVDTASLVHGLGIATATIYSSAPNTPFDRDNLMNLSFDCAGHYQNLDLPAQFNAEPGSVAEKVSTLACAKPAN